MNYDYHEAMKLSNQMCFPLYAASRSVISLYTPWLKPLGLTYTQYLVFLVLWERDGITVGEICNRLMLDNGTLSPLLKKTKQHGLRTNLQSAETTHTHYSYRNGSTLAAIGRTTQENPMRFRGCQLPHERATQSLPHFHQLRMDRNRYRRNHRTHPGDAMVLYLHERMETLCRLFVLLQRHQLPVRTVYILHSNAAVGKLTSAD